MPIKLINLSYRCAKKRMQCYYRRFSNSNIQKQTIKQVIDRIDRKFRLIYHIKTKMHSTGGFINILRDFYHCYFGQMSWFWQMNENHNMMHRWDQQKAHFRTWPVCIRAEEERREIQQHQQKTKNEKMQLSFIWRN